MKRIAVRFACIMVVLAVWGGSSPVFAQDTDKKQLMEQLRKLNNELKAVSAVLDSLKKQQAALMKEAGLAEEEVGSNEQEEPQTKLPRKIGFATFGNRARTSDDLSIRFEKKILAFEHENDALDFAIDDPQSSGGPNGELFRVDPDEVHGSRYSVWVNAPVLPFEIGFRETRFDGYWEGSAADNGAGDIWHTRMHPDSVIDSAITSANAIYDLEYRVTDVEIRKYFDWSDNLDGVLFGGARSASFETEFLIDYVDGGNRARFTEINKTSGVGPYLGLESGWQLPLGFRLQGMFNVSLLKCNTDFRMSDDVTSIFAAYNNELIPVLEYGFGVGWQATAFDTWHVKLGVEYEAQHWSDVYHQRRWSDDVDEGLNTTSEEDLDFQGLVYTIGIEKTF